MKQTRQAICAIKQSILLRCLWLNPIAKSVSLPTFYLPWPPKIIGTAKSDWEIGHVNSTQVRLKTSVQALLLLFF